MIGQDTISAGVDDRTGACDCWCRALIMAVNEPEARGVALAMQTVLDDVGKGMGPALVAALITAFHSRSVCCGLNTFSGFDEHPCIISHSLGASRHMWLDFESCHHISKTNPGKTQPAALEPHLKMGSGPLQPLHTQDAHFF